MIDLKPTPKAIERHIEWMHKSGILADAERGCAGGKR
jgi:hypothetical protein